MIGTAIRGVQNQLIQPWLVIAAGVSDSKNLNPADYQRELLLVERCLKESQHKNLPILYISSYSVKDETMIMSPYVRNKLRIERIIIDASSENRILRITNAVGHRGNPSNVINYLVHAVVSGSSFNVWRNTRRNFVDVEHIAQFVKSLDTNSDPVIELVHPQTYSLPSILETIERLFNISANYTIVDSKPNHYECNECSDSFFQGINEGDQLYLTRLLSKYYG